MRDNMAAAGGLALAEAGATGLAGRVGGPLGKQLGEAHSALAHEAATPARDQLRAGDEIRSVLSAEEVDRALDPAAYLGSAEPFVERALAAHREFEEGT